MWAAAVRSYGEHPFLEWLSDDGRRTWTYSEFDDVVAALAGALSERGVARGGRVHLVLGNSPAFVACWLAAVRLGACIVAADPRATAFELADQRSRTRPQFAVVHSGALSAYADGMAGTDEAAVVAVAGDLPDMTGTPLPPAAVEPRTPAALLFTSGTTSAPKAVVVTQANYAFAGETMARAAAVTHDSRLIVCLPLFHANAQYYSFTPAIARGATVCLLPRFSASTFIASARTSGATHASLFAAPVRMILARTPADEQPARLKQCWYAQNLTREQFDRLRQLVGCAPRQLYGMTETIPAVLTNPADHPIPASMGRVTSGCHVELRTTDGRLAAPGEQGEVVVRGERGITIFDGYLDDPQATAAALSADGALATGDFARCDAEGYFSFVGRRSDVLKVGGENVSTVEVEAVLAEHPDVVEAAVVGRPDEMLDEVPAAFVVMSRPSPEAVDRLAAWCAERLAPSKRPRTFQLVAELPRTSVGKIRKTQLPTGGVEA